MSDPTWKVRSPLNQGSFFRGLNAPDHANRILNRTLFLFLADRHVLTPILVNRVHSQKKKKKKKKKKNDAFFAILWSRTCTTILFECPLGAGRVIFSNGVNVEFNNLTLN